jgi:hypothetical protein
MEELMEKKKNRKEDRFKYEMPDMVFAEFRAGKDPGDKKLYSLKIMDCSEYGLGMLITQKDFDLLQVVKEGDELSDVSYFAAWSVNTINGTVRHKTKIGEGEYEGCYLLGIESPVTIEGCRPMSN